MASLRLAKTVVDHRIEILIPADFLIAGLEAEDSTKFSLAISCLAIGRNVIYGDNMQGKCIRE